ncbi:hypothetical protein L249_8651 [Ophiocordyceps polyrhachis-furcata BCC 54312]|uniref:Ras guanyl-nucleotide exchange factor RasGEF n=1 Tax=Ophiocordyceps polyrhachis-furcata BCC 54312 TaxID=1330021 RepID=A0A367L6D0_9HYPO|nr:hypothetical protein L249_8651 [Ophiocordyceps polyrhachis-furcata BCC 54312]
MPKPTPAHLRHLYRSLLRETPRHRPLLSSPAAPLQTYLRAGFSSSPPTTTRPSTAATEQLLVYLRSQHQYAALLERYNPGLYMDQDERLRLSARRVGLRLPASYDPPE